MSHEVLLYISKKDHFCTNLLTTSKEKQWKVLSQELYSPRGIYSEYNEILNQSARGELHILPVELII
jgi:hypothetical protein